MIQAHKTLDAASRICNDGGTLLLLAECADGFGRKDFPDWFAFENSEKLAEKLCESYQVNGQTAWNLLRIAEKFDVRTLTSLDTNQTELMRLRKLVSVEEIQEIINAKPNGYILPFGAKFHLK